LDDPVDNNDPTGLVAPDCNDLLSQINRLVFGDDQGFKGIVQRFYEQIYGSMPPGSPGWNGHNVQIQANQNGLKKLMTEFIDDKCPPPGNWGYFDQWANKPLPPSNDYKGPTNKPSYLQYVITGVSSYIFFYEVLPGFLDAVPDLLEEVPLLFAELDPVQPSLDSYEVDSSVTYVANVDESEPNSEEPNQ
jgi:hypothetical protein